MMTKIKQTKQLGIWYAEQLGWSDEQFIIDVSDVLIPN
jgi:hypothetical protein